MYLGARTVLSPRLISYLILNYFPVLQVDLSLRLPLPLCSANPPLLFEKLKINPGEGHEGNQGQEGASSARIGLLHVIKRRLKISILLLYFLFSKQRNSLLEQEREQGRLPHVWGNPPCSSWSSVTQLFVLHTSKLIF